MLFRHFVGCIYRSLREPCTTSQCAVLLVSRWTRDTHIFAICSNERKLQHSTQLMTMTYGPKKYNPSSCVAPRRKPTMAYGRITNFPSCVAWRPLCHLIMNYDRKCVKLKALFCNFTLPIYCCCKLKYCCLSHYQCCCSKYKFSLRPFLSISLYTKRELTSLNCIL